MSSSIWTVGSLERLHYFAKQYSAAARGVSQQGVTKYFIEKKETATSNQNNLPTHKDRVYTYTKLGGK